MSSNNADGQPANNGYGSSKPKLANGAGTTTTPDRVKTSSSAKSQASKESFFSTLSKLRQASKRPLPKDTGDGTYRKDESRPGLRQDLKSLGMGDLKTLYGIVSSKLKGETQQDDKTMIMERTIQLVAGLPNHSRTQEILTNDFIDELWNSLDHPPMLYMGDEFKWRHPDGSNNNPMNPKLGATGQKYSRTVKPKVTALGAQPDPEAIFEAVMARDGFKRNPNNVSSILWYWATLVIHDLFWTNMQDGNVNDSSSYLDLAILYGNTQEAQNSVRTFKNGLLKPDAFADKRLIGNPPGVCILLVMFNRFHNHVATNLAAINENNRFPRQAPGLDADKTAAAWKKYDEDLFQTARLVTSGLYINITLIDYVRNIINLNRADTTWTLDPRQEMGVSMGTKAGAESGVGNVVSAEFNLCYRWHSCISEMDEKWIQDFYTELLGDNYGDMNLQTLIGAVQKFDMSIPEDPGERTFSGLKRGPDGRFDDDELAEAMATAIEQPGGAFGARNVPRIMKPIEMLGIIRGRRWNLAGLNEFRKHFGLKAYETFEDINSDPGVADQLRNLYQHPDYVELYPGIVAEEAKTPMIPGVGIAPTYTISRVVLSDAVSLVRGDRYYTTDYHPGNLTNWGYKEVEYDLNVNHGCMFSKLFLRAFPNHFRQDSVYAHYPMVIPSENRKILTNLKRVDKFNFDRPGSQGPQINILSFGGAQHVISNQDKYSLAGQEGLEYLMGDGARRFTQSGDMQLNAGQRKYVGELLYKDGWKKAVESFYAMIAERLLSEKSYKIAGRREVDIVRDVGNLAYTHFAARLFNLPLKDSQNPKGVFSEHELYGTLALISTCVYADTAPDRLFALRQVAREATQKLGSAVETNVKLTKTFGISGLYTGKADSGPMGAYGANLIKGLCKAGLSASDITWSQILPTAGAMAPNQAAMFAQAMDWYLSPSGEAYRDDITRLAAQQSSAETDALLLGYALEGVRLSGAPGVYRNATVADSIPEGSGGEAITVHAGAHVHVSFAAAATDAAHFPEPETANPRRPLDSYIFAGAGPHAVLGRDLSQAALVAMFRAVFKKKGLRKVAGAQGELKKIPAGGGGGGAYSYLTEDWGSVWPLPTSMKVTWDA